MILVTRRNVTYMAKLLAMVTHTQCHDIYGELLVGNSVDRRSRGIIYNFISVVVSGNGHCRMEFKFVVHHTII